jgi:hypothetical protein
MEASDEDKLPESEVLGQVVSSPGYIVILLTLYPPSLIDVVRMQYFITESFTRHISRSGQSFGQQWILHRTRFHALFTCWQATQKSRTDYDRR